jgi:hypothetical protein
LNISHWWASLLHIESISEQLLQHLTVTFLMGLSCHSSMRQFIHQGREIIAIVPLENGAFCTIFSENFHKF